MNRNRVKHFLVLIVLIFGASVPFLFPDSRGQGQVVVQNLLSQMNAKEEPDQNQAQLGEVDTKTDEISQADETPLKSQISDEEVTTGPPSYRGVYTIKMLKRAFDSEVIDIQGKMYFELRKTCLGWVSQQNMTMTYTNDTGVSWNTKTNYTAWESTDHQTLKFYYKSYAADRLLEEVAGVASKVPGSEEVYVQFTSPENVEIRLLDQTVFPIEHIMLLLSHAQEKTGIISHPLFDGASYSQGFYVSSAYEKTIKLVSDQAKKFHQDDIISMRLGYYKPNSVAEESEFEVDLQILKNGVNYRTVFEYPEFSVKSTLQNYDELLSEGCELAPPHDSGTGSAEEPAHEMNSDN